MRVPIEIDYHQFNLGPDSAQDGELQQTPQPLCLLFEPRELGTAILTGAASGSVWVDVEALDAAPAQVDPAWEDVAELSLTVATGLLRVRGWGSTGPTTDRLDTSGPGTYRVRVHARGRDARPDGVAFEPEEEFLLQAWPAPLEPPVTLRATSQAARAELNL